MTTIIIPRTFSDDTYRTDVMNAVNLLFLKGILPKGTEYALGNIEHPNKVILWLRDPTNPSKFIITPRAYDPVDIITGATLDMKVLRGTRGLNGETLQ